MSDERSVAPSAALRVMFAALACSLSRFVLRRRWAAFSFSDILGWKACLPRRATAEPTFTATAVGLHPLLRGGELVLTSLTQLALASTITEQVLTLFPPEELWLDLPGKPAGKRAAPGKIGKAE